jgi:hypothetical protein
MIKIKQLTELSKKKDGFNILIEKEELPNLKNQYISAVYMDLVPDFKSDTLEFENDYFKFLNDKKDMIKQIKLLERVKKEIILVYIDDNRIVCALKKYLDGKSRIIRTSIDRTHG